MAKRTDIESVRGATIAGMRRDKEKPECINFFSQYGRLIFSVHQVFDRHGNRFEINLP